MLKILIKIFFMMCWNGLIKQNLKLLFKNCNALYYQLICLKILIKYEFLSKPFDDNVEFKMLIMVVK